ncbi:hypothetical protein VL10_ORF88 [Staphylococcus phage vB_SauM_VL10]|nr:hypothetical protein VL10_ORF88 [Staphylococcus phage vB_SauM_VL10]
MNSSISHLFLKVDDTKLKQDINKLYFSKDKVEAIKRYKKGESSTIIAKDLNCTPDTVLRWVKSYG